MAGPKWVDGHVVSVGLRDGWYVLGQFLKSPFMVFFAAYSASDDWSPHAAQQVEPLFFCAVTNQFRKFSAMRWCEQVRQRLFQDLPRYWIEPFHGSVKTTVWAGTPRERTFLTLNQRPGGRLIEKHIDDNGFTRYPVVLESIPLDDDQTIDRHELNVLWTYPNLNERLLLCKQLGTRVDPEKDLLFGRPPRDEYVTYVDILAGHGTPEDWGYHGSPAR